MPSSPFAPDNDKLCSGRRLVTGVAKSVSSSVCPTQRVAAWRSREADGVPVGLRTSDLLTYFERERLPLPAQGTQDAYKDSPRPIKAYYVKQLGGPRTRVDAGKSRHQGVEGAER